MRGPGPDSAVAGIVLAAGSSRRMRRDKLYLEFEGETVLRASTRRAVEAGLDPTIVVLGPDPERARAELAGLDVQTVVNPDHLDGMSRSLGVGIERVPDSASAAVSLLADMPFVEASMIAALIAGYRESGKSLVVSRYGDVMAPPTLYGRELFPELAAETGDGCGKRVIRRHLEDALMIDWPEEALLDLDVAEDVDRARARLAQVR